MKILEIGLPCTPAKHLSLEEISATEILVTWGGGMGGGSKKYYAISNKQNNWTLINGENIYLNPDFIVHQKPAKIIKIITDTTAHSNHSQHTCNKSILTQYILLSFEEKYEFNPNNYKSINLNKIILDDTITE